MPYEAGQPLNLPDYDDGALDLSATDGLLAVDWVKDLLGNPHVKPVLTAGALVSKESELPPDHMFSAFLKVGLLQDMLCLFDEQERVFYGIITLGDNVCGHPQITHGGMTAAIIDETLGGVNYILKRYGVINHGPSFTVHLEVDYRAPLPAGVHVLCAARLESTEGRKAWVRAEVLPRPGGAPYAVGRALFVIPRDKVAPACAVPAENGAPAAAAAGGGSGAAGGGGAGAGHGIKGGAAPGVPETECELERLSLSPRARRED